MKKFHITRRVALLCLISAMCVSTMHGPSSASGETYTVQQGDTCWSLAEDNGLDLTEFLSLNDLRLEGQDCPIKVGQQVRLR